VDGYRIDKQATLDERGRAALTVRCKDCDEIPKVSNAGQVVIADDGSNWQVMHNGILVSHGGYQGDYMADIITTLRGHHEPQEERAFWEVLQRLTGSPTMIELGAWWGYYSLWFKQGFPSGNALLFEPDPKHLELGKLNFDKNGQSAVFGLAGAGVDGVATFFDESIGQVRTVSTKSVMTICKENGVEFLDLLHLDVQGAELSALFGTEALIAQNALRFVFVSTHHHVISGDPLTHQKCLRWLQEHGAHIICEHAVSESFSGDGLIVASFSAQDAGFSFEISHARPSESLFRELEYDLADQTTLADQIRFQQDQLLQSGLERDRLLAEQQDTSRRFAEISGKLDRVTASVSWRITAPLRRVRGFHRR
jgi:FkbM family methyltransferase